MVDDSDVGSPPKGSSAKFDFVLVTVFTVIIVSGLIYLDENGILPSIQEITKATESISQKQTVQTTITIQP